MNDIKLSELGKIDYIPNDISLCCHCVHYNECPYDHKCPTYKRMEEYDLEISEL